MLSRADRDVLLSFAPLPSPGRRLRPSRSCRGCETEPSASFFCL